MKLLSSNRQHGSTLVLTLVIGLTVGTVLAAYLSLVGNRYELTMRSQCWNTAIPAAEAGIEEALTHLHDDVGRPVDNGWTNGTVGGQNVYAKARTFSDGSAYYTVIYNGTTTNPYIYSTGMIPAPRRPTTYISRTIRVNGANQPLFNLALGAINSITLNGSSVASDSFNSSLPSKSTNGQYDPSKASTNGSIGSVNGPVSLGQHSIHGNVYLGPTATASSSVSASKVSGTVYSDFNVSFPDVSLPTTSWLTATKSTVNSQQVYDFKTSGDYVVSDDSGVIVEPGVQVRLKVTSTAYVPASIHVMATNGVAGSLAIYQVSGVGTLSNVTLDDNRARDLYYYGLPGVTSITYSGATTFIGAVYAPEAVLTLNGGGSGNGFIGSAVVKSITMNGNNFVFHFDEDLLSNGPGRGVVISSWQEM